jgi:O-antigen ligase
LQDFDSSEWLFGLGQGNKVNFILANNIWVGGGTGDTYTNGFITLIVSYGIVGLIIFLIYLIRVFLKCTKGWTNSYLILMIVLMFSTTFIFDCNFIYYLMFILNSPRIAQMVGIGENVRYASVMINSNNS